MQNWDADNSDIPLVSVDCTAYNHEPYIVQILDGFLMQKTNFPFERSSCMMTQAPMGHSVSSESAWVEN